MLCVISHHTSKSEKITPNLGKSESSAIKPFSYPFLVMAASLVYILAIDWNPLTSPDRRRFPMQWQPTRNTSLKLLLNKSQDNLDFPKSHVQKIRLLHVLDSGNMNSNNFKCHFKLNSMFLGSCKTTQKVPQYHTGSSWRNLGGNTWITVQRAISLWMGHQSNYSSTNWLQRPCWTPSILQYIKANLTCLQENKIHSFKIIPYSICSQIKTSTENANRLWLIFIMASYPQWSQKCKQGGQVQWLFAMILQLVVCHGHKYVQMLTKFNSLHSFSHVYQKHYNLNHFMSQTMTSFGLLVSSLEYTRCF